LNPRAVYERLYRASSGQEGSAAKGDLLLLDQVLGDAKRLRAQVGSADQYRLDEYLSVMRSLEERVQRASAGSKTVWKAKIAIDPKTPPTDQPGSHAEHVRLMLDMIATAFQSDTTRVSTFMFGNAVSAVNFRFLETVTSGHHEVSHHGNDAEKLRQYYLITKWHVEQYSYLLGKLKSMKEGDSTVLDNSMILYGGGIGNGNLHNHERLPVVVAGGGAGTVKGGRHIEFKSDMPVSNLLRTILDKAGVQTETLGDSTGLLTEL